MTTELIEVDADVLAFTAQSRERGWGDGLPLVPPTPELVDAHLASCRHDPDESLGAVPPLNHEATYRTVAANAVMAGCLPEYFPVVTTAVAAMLDPAFNLYGLQATTNPGGPLVLVGGPIVGALDINGGGNAFGQGWTANATIGRAVRLVLLHVGGGRPQENDRATHGMPGKYSMCAAENEPESPWAPFHVRHGLDEGTNAVTIFSVQGFHNIIDLTSTTARDIMISLSAGMSAWGTNDMTHGGEPVLVLSPEHAAIMASEDWTPDDVSRFVFEHARFDLTTLPASCQERMATRRPGWVDPKRFPLADSPADIHVLVAGGPGVHAMYLPSFGSSKVITRGIDDEEGQPIASIADPRL